MYIVPGIMNGLNREIVLSGADAISRIDDKYMPLLDKVIAELLALGRDRQPDRE